MSAATIVAAITTTATMIHPVWLIVILLQEVRSDNERRGLEVHRARGGSTPRAEPLAMRLAGRVVIDPVVVVPSRAAAVRPRPVAIAWVRIAVARIAVAVRAVAIA